MNAQEILKQYQIVRAALADSVMQLPELETALYGLNVSPEMLNSLEALHAKLDRFNPVTGWIGYQSGNQYFDQQPLEIKSCYGLVLNAELTNGRGASLHVRYNGNGGWISAEYAYTAGGGDYVADRVTHLASNDEIGKLNYLRFWKNDGDNPGVNPVFACFTGFGG